MPKNGANTPLPVGGSWSGSTPMLPPCRSISSSRRMPLRSLGASSPPNLPRPCFSRLSQGSAWGRYMLTQFPLTTRE